VTTARMGPDATAEQVRGLVPPAGDVEADVREILTEVRSGGDEALRRLARRFDGPAAAEGELRVPAEELEAAARDLDPGVRAAIETAIVNVRAVADSQLRDPWPVKLPQGHRVELADVPVRRAAAYVPGGRAPYPSTVVMCAVTARAAGVEDLAVCAPPGPDGAAHPTILAACSLCGVDEVYRVGGAQAVAALGYGTASVPTVDVIVGPGNRYVQEAKRQLVGTVGIDGVAGPSELVVVASGDADAGLIALDLLAQAEHGPDSLVALISPDQSLLDMVGEAVTGSQAAVAIVKSSDVRSALALAEQIAPEHLELVGADAEALEGEVRRAGCLFVGRDAGTAFGDYVAGSNHVLPTGGAARFAGALSVATFRRRMARVSLPAGAAARLAPAGAALARAEGFPLHAESMERRA
jgi:histidinol dehydrogenase